MSALIQTAINVSEGRRPDVIEAVADAVRRTRGAALADYSADEDHNRMVVTVLGGPAAVRDAALAVARTAVERIDLKSHRGAHPRLGAVDVIPLTPLREVSMEDCVAVSREIAHDLGNLLELPVYYYEASAPPGRRSSLPEIRAGGFEGLLDAPLEGRRRPDVGPLQPHPTAGAVVVGARGPLVAYNVDLCCTDAVLANRIAGAVRTARDKQMDLHGARALGLWLPSRRRAQVSMNITRPDLTPLPPIYDFVNERALAEGATVWGSEIVGLAPLASIPSGPDRIRWHGYRETQTVEYWLEKL